MPRVLIWESGMKRWVGSMAMARRRKASRGSASLGEFHAQNLPKFEVRWLKG